MSTRVSVLATTTMEKLFEGTQTLTLFLFFFLPGFVSLKVYDSLVPSERRDFSKSIYEVVAYSTLNYALLYPLVAWTLSRSNSVHPVLVWVDGAFVLVAFPSLWPFIWIRVLRTRVFSKHFVHPIQKPWDFVFGQRKPYWTIVHLKDLRKIGGVYGERSFASSNPAPPQIYLEEVWELDEAGHFVQPVDDSEGVLILESEILAVELFNYTGSEVCGDGRRDEERDNGQGGLSAQAGEGLQARDPRPPATA